MEYLLSDFNDYTMAVFNGTSDSTAEIWEITFSDSLYDQTTFHLLGNKNPRKDIGVWEPEKVAIIFVPNGSAIIIKEQEISC